MTTIHECKNNASFFLNLSTIQRNIVDYKRRKGSTARHTQRFVLENMLKSDRAYTKYLLTRLPQANQPLRTAGIAAYGAGEGWDFNDIYFYTEWQRCRRKIVIRALELDTSLDPDALALSHRRSARSRRVA